MDCIVNKKKRSLLRTLSVMSAGAGLVLALAASGNSDFLDDLKNSEPEARARYEKEVISEKQIMNMALSGILLMGVGVVGLLCSEKKR